MNSVSLIGRVGQSPELKYTTSGLATTRFSLAVRGNDKDSTIWIKIVAWKNMAETITRYVKKGDLIGIIGRVNVRQYTKGDEKRTICEVVADRVDFCDNKKENSDAEETKSDGVEELANELASVEDVDLPF